VTAPAPGKSPAGFVGVGNMGRRMAANLAAVGIGAPGPIDFDTGYVIETANLRFKNFPLGPRIAEVFGRPTIIENDVNAGMYGEFKAGAAVGANDVLGVFVGTGIGGGLILNGALYRGFNKGAGEIGHIIVNAGGPRCFKYGVTGDYVLALEAVTADGRIFRTGPATRKNATGTRLAQLLVGSEGTLAVVTEATLRLVPAPAGRVAATASFGSIEAAGEAVAAIVAEGLVPSALELLDAECLQLAGLPDAAAMLLVEVDGPDAASVAAELSLVERALRRAGALGLELASEEHEIERLWEARRAMSAAISDAAAYHLFQDVCVPPAAIPEALRRIGEIAVAHRVRIPVFGHAGDGNLHPSVLYDDAGEADAAHAAEADVLRAAVALGGTVSAEHGIGLLKVPFLADVLDPVALELARGIKRALDPRGILNPGKLLP